MKRLFSSAALLVSMSPMCDAQTCVEPPSNAIRVNNDYVPDPNGDWWLLDNWRDTNGDGYINRTDFFNFMDPNAVGQPVPLADVCLMKYVNPSDNQTWFYITGTGTGVNFRIYRTRDFRTFELHMLAFDNSFLNGSNQGLIYVQGDPVDFRRLSLDGPSAPVSSLYQNLWGGELFNDPTEPAGPTRRIYLTLSATKGTLDTSESTSYQVSISEADFLSWHSHSPPGSGDGPRFSDVYRVAGQTPPEGYYYTNNNLPPGVKIRDGGFSISPGHLIPCSTAPTGQLCGELGDQSVYAKWFNCQGAAPHVMTDGGMFFDPNLLSSDPWKRVLLYNWWAADAGTACTMWGTHIVAHPLLNNIQADKNYVSIPIANCRNVYNPVGVSENGTVGTDGSPFRIGGPGTCICGVGEGATAFYLESTKRYYVVYARNTWNSTAYQLVYRMSEPGAPFSSLALPSGPGGEPPFENRWAQEYLLLRANNYTDAWTPTPAGAGKASFGGARAFRVFSGSGTPLKDPVQYLAFHCMLDYQDSMGFYGGRTCFFKELTVQDYNTGELVQLKLGSDDPRADAARFRMPYCRR